MRTLLIFLLLAGFSDAVMLTGYNTGAPTLAHTYLGKTQGSYSSANPKTMSMTVDAGTTLLVLTIQHTQIARTGGAPTWNGVSMTQVGSDVLDSAEVGVEMWYLIDPAAGTYSISVPNTVPSIIRLTASWYSTNSGYVSTLDQNTSTTVDSANPSLSRTTTENGAVCIDIVGSGSDDPGTARSDTLLYANDEGTINFESQYYLQSTAGAKTMDHTFPVSENIAMIMACFKPVAR